MTNEEIIIELTKDYYSLKKAYKNEQEQSKTYRGWWQEEKEDKKILSGIMTKEINELKEVIDRAGAEEKAMKKSTDDESKS